MKIIFLHIPKTAGQSVHRALVNSFGLDAICPARNNKQLMLLTENQMNQYICFSGHFDTQHFSKIEGPKFIFTILRDPIERILSFYFYLRARGSKLSNSTLMKPEFQGIKMALEMKPSEYFFGGSSRFNAFIGDHYDNFYTYYFASGKFRGRGEYLSLIRQGSISESDLLGLASENLKKMDHIFSTNDMRSVIEMLINLGAGNLNIHKEIRVNSNTEIFVEDRVKMICELEGDSNFMARLSEFTRLDYMLLNERKCIVV